MLEEYFSHTSLVVSSIFCAVSVYNLYLMHRKKIKIKNKLDNFIFNQFMFISGFLFSNQNPHFFRNMFNSNRTRNEDTVSNGHNIHRSRNRHNNRHVRRHTPHTINILIPDFSQNIPQDNVQENISSTILNEIINHLRTETHQAPFNRFPESNNVNNNTNN